MDAIGDDFGGDFGIGQDRADNAGIAVSEGRMALYICTAWRAPA